MMSMSFKAFERRGVWRRLRHQTNLLEMINFQTLKFQKWFKSVLIFFRFDWKLGLRRIFAQVRPQTETNCASACFVCLYVTNCFEPIRHAWLFVSATTKLYWLKYERVWRLSGPSLLILCIDLRQTKWIVLLCLFWFNNTPECFFLLVIKKIAN